MSELKYMHAKTECLPFNTEDVRLIITERYGKQEIRMHGEDARFIVEAIAAAKRRTQPEATKPAQDLSAAILALEHDCTGGAGAHNYIAGFNYAKQLAAALASPPQALSAVDSETVKDSERLNFVLENGVPMMRGGEYRFHGFPGKWFKTDREAIDHAILQSQGAKNG